jgi:hypothetical protein
MVFEIVGREAELASLNAFIDETEGGAAALVLEGEAGSESRRSGEQPSSTRGYAD